MTPKTKPNSISKEVETIRHRDQEDLKGAGREPPGGHPATWKRKRKRVKATSKKKEKKGRPKISKRMRIAKLSGLLPPGISTDPGPQSGQGSRRKIK